MQFIYICLIAIVGSSCAYCAAYVDRAIQKELDALGELEELVSSDKKEAPSCVCPNVPKHPRPADCSEILANGYNESGVYHIHPKGRSIDCDSLEVYCDMETAGGGWTVIQRRGDFGNSENFFQKNWQSYKKGFGNIKKEFWIGNDHIHAFTNQDSYSVRIDMERLNGEKKFVMYDMFYIDDEEQNYKLHIQEPSGTARDALSKHHHLGLFYTLDKPNWPQGRKNGDQMHKGGWWLNTYPSSNLNGINRQAIISGAEKDGILWDGVGEKEYNEPLAATQMAIRPTKFYL